MTIHNDKIDAVTACVRSYLDSPLDRAEALQSAGRQVRLTEIIDSHQRWVAIDRLVASGTITEEEREKYF
jgi:hypothetical protein